MKNIIFLVIFTMLSSNAFAGNQFAVQISYVTHNGGRTTTTELIEAQNEKDAKNKAQQIIAEKYNQGRIVSVGKR